MDATEAATHNPLARIDTVGVIVRRWKMIAVWTVGVTAVAAILSFFLSKTYRAEAQLLVSPSPYKASALDQTTLDVEIYEKVLSHDALVDEVKRELKLEDISIEKLRSKMKVVAIRRPSQRETTYSPFLLLQVKDRDPDRCQAIVNKWADLATTASLRIKSEVLRQTNVRIRTMHEDTKRLLEQQEDTLKDFDTTAMLTERRAELEIVRTQLSAEQDNLESLRLQFSAAQTRLDSLKSRYAAFFRDGLWIGTLYSNNTTGGLTDATARLSSPKSERVPPKTWQAVPSSTDTLALQFLLARNDLVEKMQSSTDFKIKQRTDTTRQRHEDLNNKIPRLEQDIEDMKLDLAEQKAKLHDVEATADLVPQRLMVSKAISDEALWNVLTKRLTTGSHTLDGLTTSRLISEEINPLWLSAQGRIQFARSEIASLESGLKASEELLERLLKEHEELDKAVAVQSQVTQNLQTEVQVARERYDTLAAEFVGVSSEIMRQEAEAARLHKEITNSQSQVERLTSAAMQLNAYTVAKELDHERLQRDLASVKNIYTTLAQKYEEARITELEVSGDLQIAFRAVRPEQAIGPKRPLIIGVALLCSLFLFSLMALAREHIRLSAA